MKDREGLKSTISTEQGKSRGTGGSFVLKGSGKRYGQMIDGGGSSLRAPDNSCQVVGKSFKLGQYRNA